MKASYVVNEAGDAMTIIWSVSILSSISKLYLQGNGLAGH